MIAVRYYDGYLEFRDRKNKRIGSVRVTGSIHVGFTEAKRFECG
jgi:hypothetical protein